MLEDIKEHKFSRMCVKQIYKRFMDKYVYNL